MAEAFGARLLKEVHSETLDELLSSLSATLPLEQNPSVPSVAFLQELLRFQEMPPTPAPVTQVQDESRPVVDPSIPSSPSPLSSPPVQNATSAEDTKIRYAKPPILEITSASTNAGRTHLVNHMLSSILPIQPGRPREVIIYFDCAYKLSILDLYASLVKSCSGNEDMAKEALSRLHIIRPESSRQLLTQLRKVEPYLFSLPSKDMTVAAVFVADLSVYYWSERWAEEEARYRSGAATKERIYSRESLHTMILAELRRLQKVFRCVVIVSGLGIIARARADESSTVRSGLTGTWVQAVDVRVVLGKTINGRIATVIDGRKWLTACGARDGIGKARCEIHVNSDGIEVSELKRET